MTSVLRGTPRLHIRSCFFEELIKDLLILPSQCPSKLLPFLNFLFQDLAIREIRLLHRSSLRILACLCSNHITIHLFSYQLGLQFWSLLKRFKIRSQNLLRNISDGNPGFGVSTSPPYRGLRQRVGIVKISYLLKAKRSPIILRWFHTDFLPEVVI